MVNTATVAPPAGIVELDPSDNAATDTDVVLAVLFADGFDSGTTWTWSGAVPSACQVRTFGDSWWPRCAG